MTFFLVNWQTEQAFNFNFAAYSDYDDYLYSPLMGYKVIANSPPPPRHFV